MNNIETRLKNVLHQIETVSQQYHRNPSSVKLVLASKGQTVEKMREALQTGHSIFGENYLQEALAKMQAFSAFPVEWHFIGAIQTNKTKGIASHFDWVQSVCSYKIAQRLSEQRPLSLPALNICLQVNLDNEPTKEGIGVNELSALAVKIAALPKLKLRGLMSIPAPTEDKSQQRQTFKRCRELLIGLQALGLDVDTLSMGMSNDFEAAIAEGATLVRIGTAVFGERK